MAAKKTKISKNTMNQPVSVPVVSAIDEMLKNGIIVSQQRSEILKLYLELQEKLKEADAYKLLEPIRNMIPPEMMKIGTLTYEEALLLTWAVQLSNIKRAGSFFNA